MTLEEHARAVIDEYRGRPDSSARTLLVTILGDSIAPHGGEVWIGSLVRLVEPLGINERLVRTSLNRLVREGLLETRREGRRSFYALTASARQEFARAEPRIYERRRAPWDGCWTIVVEGNGLDGAARTSLRERLGWLGFRSLAGPVHVAPVDRVTELRALLGDLDLAGHVAVFRGRAPDAAGLTDQALVEITSAELAVIEPAWNDFLRRFGPLAAAAARRRDGDSLPPETAFLTRTLVVHAYRRVALREPELPAGLWPPGWAGDEAYEVASRCYEILGPAAAEHLRAVVDGPPATGGGRPALRMAGR